MGANPNVYDSMMNGPLALVTTYQCAMLLLIAGANPHHRNLVGKNSITAAAALLPDPRYISELLRRGVDVNGPTYDHNALPFFKSHEKSLVEILLDHGANLNGKDSEGNSCLAEFVWAGADDSAQLLLERGADYTMINSHGNTILHVIAECGSLHIVSVLQSMASRGVDVEGLNKEGQSPWEVACRRVPKPDDFMEAFHSLLLDMCQRNKSQTSHKLEAVNEDQAVHSDKTEISVDAFEEQAR